MIFDLSKDIESVSEITSSFFNVPSVKVFAIVGKGTVNKVFVVDTGNAKVVVRMRDETEAFDEYAKEAWCIAKAAAQGVPVPTVLTVGLFEETAYMIQSYIAGDEACNSQLSPGYIWQQLGKYAKLIHSIEVAGFGLNMSDLTEGDSQELWLKYLDYNIDSLNEGDELIKLNVVTESQSKIIRTVFENLQRKTFNFGLNHGDIMLRNVIVNQSGKVNLLDWGSAEASIVPHHDLIQMLKENMLENAPDVKEIRAFLDGYGISQIEFEQMLPDLESLLLLRAFDKLRWSIDWNVEKLGEFVSHAKDVVERYLSGIRQP